DRLIENRDVQRLELVEEVLVHIRRRAVGTDDQLFGPRRQGERHPDRLSPFPDYYRVLVARLVAVAVGADVNRFAEAVSQTGNRRPDILDADRQQNPSRLYLGAVAQLNREQLAGLVQGSVHDAANEIHAVLGAFSAADLAQLR